MTDLYTLPVLLMDCQATGASPTKGDLIDIAWCAATAQDDDATIEDRIQASLVQLRTQSHVSNRITQLTGITTAMLEEAPSFEEVAQSLQATVTGLEGAHLLAHYARYERPFVQALLERDEVNFICTHDIARKLLPGLPRRGLRPLAGYFGKVPEEVKRASDHVLATGLIWRELVELLTQEEGVTTLEELHEWSAKTKAKRNAARQLPLPREVRLALPEQPGVYRMLSKQETVLYVGKATSLKQRVNSYFRGRKGVAEKTLELITQIWALDVTTVGSPFEAALLETDEIKRLDPPYNKQLKQLDRQIWYANPEDPLDLQGHYDQSHTLGPFGSTYSIQRAGATLRTIQGTMAPEMGDIFFDIGAEDEVFQEGLTLFVARHALTPDITHDQMYALGQTLWLERLERLIALAAEQAAAEALAAEEQNDADATEHDTPGAQIDEEMLAALEELEEEDFEWTPGAVCGAFNNVLIRYYKSIERAKALVDLMDITIDWLPTHDPDSSPQRLVLRRGQLDPGGEPTPKEPTQRYACIDVDTYDRLQVTLTEIRRVWSKKHPITLTHIDGTVMDIDDIGVMLTTTHSNI